MSGPEDDQVFAARCPYCGQVVDLYIESDVRGVFVQDCDVCCRPWQVRVTRKGVQRVVEIRRADGAE